MSAFTLTPRLACIADLVPIGGRLADIGTDHGFLPLALILNHKIGKAIASDLRPGPLDRARKNAEASHCMDCLSLRLGAGLESILPSECDTVVIAGMGGQTIAQILNAAAWTRKGQHRLLLQPMTMLPELRQYLWSHGYQIEKEVVCSEGRRYYVVLQVTGKQSEDCVTAPPIAACYYSKALLQDERAREYLSALLCREEKALQGMKRGRASTAPQLEQQRQVVKSLMQAVRENHDNSTGDFIVP